MAAIRTILSSIRRGAHGVLELGWEKIAEIDITENTSVITITGLDLDDAKTYMILFKLRNPLGVTVRYRLQFNGDTEDTNYYSQMMEGEGATAAASRVNTAEYNYLLTGGSAISQTVIMRTPEGYTQAVQMMSKYEPPGFPLIAQLMTNIYNVDANITQIDIRAEIANGIGVGSKVILFKVK